MLKQIHQGSNKSLFKKEKSSETVTSLYQAKGQFKRQREFGNMMVGRQARQQHRGIQINKPGNNSEQEADAVAKQVLKMKSTAFPVNNEGGAAQNTLQSRNTQIQKKPITARAVSQVSPANGRHHSQQNINQLNGKGQALPTQTQTYFGDRFGYDFSNVKIHTGGYAEKLTQSYQAKAFTLNNNITFARGEYNPVSSSGQHLLAHELTHVVQQNGRNTNQIQRTIELRPPGRGEATAFDRANEIVDRLNRLTNAVSYRLAGDGRTLTYQVLLQDGVGTFDQQMMDFIDLEQVIPMRLVTSAGTIGAGRPVVIDNFQLGYVDLDDLQASDDLAFQSFLVHFLEERAVTRRYDERIGTQSLNSNTPAGSRAFNRGHRAGHIAQAEHFRGVFNDPSLNFNFERRRNNAGDAEIVFRSAIYNYRIIISAPRAATSVTGRLPRSITGGTVSVRYQGQTFTVEDFLNNGPLAAILRPPQNPLGAFNLRRLNFGPGMPRPRFGAGLGVPRLTLGPGLGMPNLLPPPLPANPINPNLTLAPSQPNTATSLLTRPFPRVSPDLSLINWLPIRSELIARGVPFDDRMGDSITELWINNYSFLNRVIGLSPERAAFWTNRTIPLAVGSGLNRDFPTLIEQMDRELNTSSINIPVSDILIFLIDR